MIQIILILPIAIFLYTDSMKFLHTADWHLGKNLYDVPLLDDQRIFLDQIISIFREAEKSEPYDALFVSGDIFDKAIASTDAINLLDDFLIKMNMEFPKAHIFLLAGNHDSAARLSFGSSFLEKSNIHICAGTERLSDATRIGNTAVYQIPFLMPGSLPRDDEFSAPPRTQAELFEKATRIILESHEQNHAGLFPVVLAHATVFGSENDEVTAQVGALDSISPTLFKDFCYTALGHIHKCQRLDKDDKIYYSGSPLAYSFDDSGEKQFLSGTIDGSGKVKIEKIPVKTNHPLVRLSGPFSDFKDTDKYSQYENHYVEIRCTDRTICENPKLLLKSKFPNIISFVREVAVSMSDNEDFYRRRSLMKKRSSISEGEMLSIFLSDMHGENLNEAESKKEVSLFSKMLSEIKTAGVDE